MTGGHAGEHSRCTGGVVERGWSINMNCPYLLEFWGLVR